MNAIPGLSFKPGPATLLTRFTTTDQTTTEPIVSESGPESIFIPKWYFITPA